jgi:hypothetical protein
MTTVPFLMTSGRKISPKIPMTNALGLALVLMREMLASDSSTAVEDLPFVSIDQQLLSVKVESM